MFLFNSFQIVDAIDAQPPNSANCQWFSSNNNNNNNNANDEDRRNLPSVILQLLNRDNE